MRESFGYSLYTENPPSGSLANEEDLDEMLQNVAFHLSGPPQDICIKLDGGKSKSVCKGLRK